jgi:hypothetical protein
MLLKAGLIRLAESDGGRREKPYQAVSKHIAVAPELLSAGVLSDYHSAMLDEVQHGLAKYSQAGRFRSLNDTVRIDSERLVTLIESAIAQAQSEHDTDAEPVVVSVFVHPPATRE